MITPPTLGLRFCARVLGGMAERNPRMIENRHWQLASQGVAGLVKDVESLKGYRNILEIDFAAIARETLEDPNQLNLNFARA